MPDPKRPTPPTPPDELETLRVGNVPGQAVADQETLSISLLGPTGIQREWRFARGESVIIGRGSAASVFVDDQAISRQHATVEFGELGWTYRHQGSNPSLLQGQPVVETRLQRGTVIRLRENGPRLQFDPGPALVDEANKSSKPITVWVNELAQGDSDAATHLWEAYFERIARLAKLRLKPALRRVSDEEDVAASVFASLCDGILEGRFPELASRENLWRLLTTMTARKAIDVANHASRKKRGGGAVRGESIFLDCDGDFGFEQFIALADSPEFESQLTEEVELRLQALGSDELRRVAQLRLEGYTVEEIAEQLGCNARTVQRRLQSIREVWADDEPPTGDEG